MGWAFPPEAEPAPVPFLAAGPAPARRSPRPSAHAPPRAGAAPFLSRADTRDGLARDTCPWEQPTSGPVTPSHRCPCSTSGAAVSGPGEGEDSGQASVGGGALVKPAADRAAGQAGLSCKQFYPPL